MAKVLIVNADDYGLAPAVSAGIRQAHLRGLVTSTTAMMNMSTAPDELRRARDECPRLGLGVHLVLTAGRPLLPPREVSSLVDPADGEHFPSLAVFMQRRAEIDPAQAEAEWRAQIERFCAATGQRPTHLDSHHHAAYLTPALLRAMLGLAESYGTAIRMPMTTPAVVQAVTGLPDSAQMIETILAQVGRVMTEAGFRRHPDHFEPRFYGEHATVETLRRLLGNLPDGSTELMCHPALADPALDRITSYGSQARARELAALSAPEARAALAPGVRLASFTAL